MRLDQDTADDPSGSASPGRIQLSRPQRILIAVILAGAVVIATIGFVGSYAAVRDLAERKGFGEFAPFFPIGIDAGIVVLLALDLLLTWLRIPFPLLRQTAWLLTAATVAFNGAAAWGDPLGVGMHGIIPVLFVITVEAARHAIGRIAAITADRHMEGVRLWRWVLAPIPTFRLWRRMKLWELRSYQEVIDQERDRLVYRAHLRARYGRAWRRRAPVEARLPLKLAHLGVPLEDPVPASVEAGEPPSQTVESALEKGSDSPTAEVEITRPHVELAPLPAPAAPPAGTREVEEELHDETAEHRFQREPVREPVYAGVSPAPGTGGHRRPTVQVRVPERTPVLDAEPEPEAEPAAEQEPELTGAQLLESRYLQLAPAERAQSASALARQLWEGTGLTEGTARKYLGDIIRTHSPR